MNVNAANATFSASNYKSVARMKEKVAFYFLLIITTIFTAHGQKKENHYLKEGISFSTLTTWQTVADEAIPDVGHYVSFERKGKGATGLFTVTWLNKEEEPSNALLAQMATMKNANIYRNPGIEFTTIEEDGFAGIQGRVVNYETIVKDEKLDGTIWAFNCSGRTIIVFYQTGMTDRKENEKGFQLLHQTFACR
jgi:hypothetical protein